MARISYPRPWCEMRREIIANQYRCSSGHVHLVPKPVKQIEAPHEVETPSAYSQRLGQLYTMLVHAADAGDVMPPHSEMCRKLNCSLSNVAYLLRRLEADGAVVMIRGSEMGETARKIALRIVATDQTIRTKTAPQEWAP